jgi:hypothetical protein
MRLNDFFDIPELHTAIPNCLGIDDDGRAVLTLIEASGFVGANSTLQSKLSEAVFEGFLELTFCSGITAATRGFRLALVPANENMFFIISHADSLREAAKNSGSRRGQLVVERDHGFTALAIGRHALQSTTRLVDGHDRAVAVDRMSGLCQVPAAAFADVLGDGSGYRRI